MELVTPARSRCYVRIVKLDCTSVVAFRTTNPMYKHAFVKYADERVARNIYTPDEDGTTYIVLPILQLAHAPFHSVQ